MGCLCWCHQVFLSLSCLPGHVMVLRTLLSVGVICLLEHCITPFLVPHLLSEMHHSSVAALSSFETLVHFYRKFEYSAVTDVKWKDESNLVLLFKNDLISYPIKPVWMLFTYPVVNSKYGLSWSEKCFFTILWIACVFFGE